MSVAFRREEETVAGIIVETDAVPFVNSNVKTTTEIAAVSVGIEIAVRI